MHSPQLVGVKRKSPYQRSRAMFFTSHTERHLLRKNTQMPRSLTRPNKRIISFGQMLFKQISIASAHPGQNLRSITHRSTIPAVFRSCRKIPAVIFRWHWRWYVSRTGWRGQYTGGCIPGIHRTIHWQCRYVYCVGSLHESGFRSIQSIIVDTLNLTAGGLILAVNQIARIFNVGRPHVASHLVD